jgi:hypothetical protein
VSLGSKVTVIGLGASAATDAVEVKSTKPDESRAEEVSTDTSLLNLDCMLVVPFKQGLKGDREKKLRTQFSRRFTGTRGRTLVEMMELFNLLAKTNLMF